MFGAMSGACDSGWSSYGDKCYKVSDTKYSWSNGRSACQQLGGDLTSILHSAEKDFISTIT